MPVPRHGLPSISCVLPCRNEARNLELLLPRLAKVLSRISEHFEVIIVDDGSADDTTKVLAQWSTRSGFRVIELSRNFGKEAALSAGLNAARGDVVITMDTDLQHEPELIPTLLQKWRQGYVTRRMRCAAHVRTKACSNAWVRACSTRPWPRAGSSFPPMPVIFA
ncbi:MAG: glycosyltransferase family 2 protein [Burkholderiaceae bacterium]